MIDILDEFIVEWQVVRLKDENIILINCPLFYKCLVYLVWMVVGIKSYHCWPLASDEVVDEQLA